MRFLIAIALTLFSVTLANAQGVTSLCVRGTTGNCVPVTASAPLPITGSFSAGGFAAATYGTPITATTGGATGTLPAGSTVVATNVGTINGAYCKLGASSDTTGQYIAPNGGWFQYTVGVATQLTCVTSTSTTTINMTGGAGLPTGTGGGSGGGGGGGAITMASGAVSSGAYAAGSIASGAMVDLGAQADAACSTDNGTCTLIALVKHNNQLITAGTIATGVAGTPSSQYLSVQGGVGMTPVITNSTQLNGVAFLAGNGATGTGSPRVTIANDNSPIATQPAIGTAKYLHQVISIASSGQNTVIARTIGTIKVYALELSCASTVTTADPRNGASTSLGAMSNFNSTFKWLNGEPVFSTTGTNDFTINLSSAVACTGWAKYIDS